MSSCFLASEDLKRFFAQVKEGNTRAVKIGIENGKNLLSLRKKEILKLIFQKALLIMYLIELRELM